MDIKLKFEITYQVFLFGIERIHNSMDDPYVCLANELAAPPLLSVGCGCELVGWSPGSRGRHGG